MNRALGGHEGGGPIEWKGQRFDRNELTKCMK